MWTYLLIFLSLITVVAVFVHRASVMRRDQAPSTEEADKEEEPVEDGDEVSRKDRARAKALCGKAEELLKRGREDEAIKHFVQALSLDPNHPETLHRLAMLYLQKEMFNPAIALFNQLAAMQQDPVHFSHLGFAHFRQNEFEQARDAYQRAVALDDSRPQRFVSLSQVYRLLGRPHHAAIALEKALEREPENRDYVFLMSDLKKETGFLEEALGLLDQVLDVEPENMEAKILQDDLKKLIEDRIKDEFKGEN